MKPCDILKENNTFVKIFTAYKRTQFAKEQNLNNFYIGPHSVYDNAIYVVLFKLI